MEVNRIFRRRIQGFPFQIRKKVASKRRQVASERNSTCVKPSPLLHSVIKPNFVPYINEKGFLAIDWLCLQQRRIICPDEASPL